MLKNHRLYPLLLLIWIGFGTACNENPTEQETANEQELASEKELTLQRGALSVSVDAAIGGRFSSFKWKDLEFLKTSRDADHLQWGSTIWPAPQSAWDWPPPAGMDKGPYELLTQNAKELVLKSTNNDYKGIEVKKKIQLNEDRVGIDITYTFHNRGEDSLSVGIWENSRISYTGTVYWKSQASQKLESLSIDEHPGKKYKQFVDDGSGWLAYEKGGYIWIKAMQMPPNSDIAPGQAGIEIYLDRADGFAEIEDHGPYQKLAPGESMSFEVKWTVFDTGGEEPASVLRQVYE